MGRKRVFSKAEAWIDLLQSARYDQSEKSALIKGNLVTWKRGQFPASVRFLEQRWNWSVKKVFNFLLLLEKEGMIERLESGHQTVISIINYDRYNKGEHLEKQERKQLEKHVESELVSVSLDMGNGEGNTKGNTEGNDQETVGKQSGNKTVIKNKESKEREEEYDAPDSALLKIKYSEVEKTIAGIGSFIRHYKPKFHQPYFDIWNLFANANKKPIATKMTSTRASKLGTRLTEIQFDFCKILDMASQSQFIIDQDNHWFNLDWLVENDNNYIKVLEGKYITAKKSESEKPKSEFTKVFEKAMKYLNVDDSRYMDGRLHQFAYADAESPYQISEINDPDVRRFVQAFLNGRNGENPQCNSHEQLYKLLCTIEAKEMVY